MINVFRFLFDPNYKNGKQNRHDGKNKNQWHDCRKSIEPHRKTIENNTEDQRKFYLVQLFFSSTKVLWEGASRGTGVERLLYAITPG
jgi:hypothetical protein